MPVKSITPISIDVLSYYHQNFQEHHRVAAATEQALQEDFLTLVTLCHQSVRQGCKIIFFGNGGSAADAQHLATELTVRFIENRKPIAALALTTDTSALTAIGNDFGFDHLFARQIEALGKPGDVAIGITTSGKSANVLKAFDMAHLKGLHTVALTGQAGLISTANVSSQPVSLILRVPSRTTSRIQEMHITLGQMLCGALENALDLVNQNSLKP